MAHLLMQTPLVEESVDSTAAYKGELRGGKVCLYICDSTQSALWSPFEGTTTLFESFVRVNRHQFTLW